VSNTPNSILAELVSKTLVGGNSILNEQQKTTFHREFEKQIREPVEQIRSEKRKYYDKTQHIAFW